MAENFHIFDKANEGKRVTTDFYYVYILNDRHFGAYVPQAGKIVIRNLKKVDYYISIHFIAVPFFHYDDCATVIVKNKEEKVLAEIKLTQNNKYPKHTFLVKKENIIKGKLELHLSRNLECEKPPVMAGISWSEKPEEKESYNSAAIAIQGFTGSGAGAVWDLFSEYDNIDMERDSELRFLGRYNQLKKELLNHPNELAWNDGCLKHFIREIYFFYNRVNVHGFEISNIYDDNYITSWNNFFAELVNAKKYLGEKLNNTKFRFPTEYSEEFKDAPFVKDGKKFYSVSVNLIREIDNIAAKHLVFLSKFQGKKFRALNNLCCRMNYSSIKIVGATKIVAVWRDPRSQYSQVLQRTNKNNIPVEFSDVETFIKYFKEEEVPWIDGKSSNVLAVRFEDLCLNYQKTVRKIEKFLGLKHKEHTFPLMFFDPIDSMQNCNYWENSDNQVDIARIHQALPRYCYDFKKIRFFNYWKIRLLSHLTYGKFQKYLKELKKFYRNKMPTVNEQQILISSDMKKIIDELVDLKKQVEIVTAKMSKDINEEAKII